MAVFSSPPMADLEVAPPDGTDGTSSAIDAFIKRVAHAPAAIALPKPGDVLEGKYRVERLLGRGGMGAVFAARHLLLNQDVALKLMLPQLDGSEEAYTRFLREAQSAAQIEGEHIARVFDVGRLNGKTPYMALELLTGANLSEVIAKRGRLAPETAVHYILQVLDALSQAHALGIVHRDIKPANIFLAQTRASGEVIKVLDFGISKAMTDPAEPASPGLTNSAAMLGSPLYMSPEQVRASKHVDHRSDIWSVGVVLFELLAEVPPFDARGSHQVLVQILEDVPSDLNVLRPGLPRALRDAVSRCLEKEPEARFSDVAALATALAPFAPGEARLTIERILRTSSSKELLRGSRPTAARFKAAFAFAAVSVCALGGLGYSFMRGPVDADKPKPAVPPNPSPEVQAAATATPPVTPPSAPPSVTDPPKVATPKAKPRIPVAPAPSIAPYPFPE